MGSAESAAVHQGVVAEAPAEAVQLATSLGSAQARSIDTVIFLDVDGVLNIGACDSEEAPLLLNETNVEIMKEAQSMQPWQMTEESRVMIEKLACVVQKKGSLMVDGKSHVHSELTRRLANIIKAAGENTAVVFASTWRKASRSDKVLGLEADISRHLGRPFTFAAKTADRVERTAADRLEAIADSLVQLSNQRSGLTQQLKALVLEDFFITGMDGWSCGGVHMNSVADAEGYLIGRVGAWASTPVQVKIMHCFEQWRTPSGLDVKCGGGLTLKHIDEAAAFLRDEQVAESEESETEDGPSRPLAIKLLSSLADPSAAMKDAPHRVALSDLDADAKPRRDPADFCSAATTAPTRSMTPDSSLAESSASDIQQRTTSRQYSEHSLEMPMRQRVQMLPMLKLTKETPAKPRPADVAMVAHVSSDDEATSDSDIETPACSAMFPACSSVECQKLGNLDIQESDDDA